MLNKKESEVMNAVYELSAGKNVCLVSPAELLAMLSPRGKYTEEMLEEIWDALSMAIDFEVK